MKLFTGAETNILPERCSRPLDVHRCLCVPVAASIWTKNILPSGRASCLTRKHGKRRLFGQTRHALRYSTAGQQRCQLLHKQGHIIGGRFISWRMATVYRLAWKSDAILPIGLSAKFNWHFGRLIFRPSSICGVQLDCEQGKRSSWLQVNLLNLLIVRL